MARRIQVLSRAAAGGAGVRALLQFAAVDPAAQLPPTRVQR